jgi:hypothetical protein
MLTTKELATFNDDQEVVLTEVAPTCRIRSFFFELSQTELNVKSLNKLGGLSALESKLKTDYRKGLSGDQTDLAERVKLYGRNEVSCDQ